MVLKYPQPTSISSLNLAAQILQPKLTTKFSRSNFKDQINH